ncbi:MAG: GDP-fucose synthetase [Pseudopedobacter saltans]|uniref:GDP-L-fucose synthase n=1 Tax=Pseudopedobacter saltans TaxID=151895 RepID=A0A2W5GMX4_9SPHI|nr:MAG: GDP-fucose synthetase [Pseudopedobacter saltans]
MEKSSKIYIAGHNGMVGSAIKRHLEKLNYSNIVVKSSKELDLRRQQDVFDFFEKEKPEYVFLAAAKVGGIIANDTYRGEFIYDNLMIESNIIEASRINNVVKLLFLGSACIYPKITEQPIKESYFLTGILEPSNEPYAIAKIAGIKLCEAYRDQYQCNYISAMPTNLYGIGDNYHPLNSHVLPGIMRRIHEAKINNLSNVTIWGSGTPTRDFLYADDLADACIFLMEKYDSKDFVNIASGYEVTIKELAETIKDVIGYEGQLEFDIAKPDGTPRRAMDVTFLKKLGWSYKTNLKEGISKSYEDFLANNYS